MKTNDDRPEMSPKEKVMERHEESIENNLAHFPKEVQQRYFRNIRMYAEEQRLMDKWARSGFVAIPGMTIAGQDFYEQGT